MTAASISTASDSPDVATSVALRAPGRDATMPVRTHSRRDHRIDMIRGFALVSIFINHMPGNRLGEFTSRNLGFSDAAEIFVLLAGFAAAMAFYPTLASRGVVAASMKAFRRAGLLYGAHLGLTLAAVLLFGSVMAGAGFSDTYDLIGVGPALEAPSDSLNAVLLGELQFGYFNILPLYVALLVMLPAMLWLAAHDLRLLAAVSSAVYLAANAGFISMPHHASLDGWFFNPLGWQALFAAGLILGIRKLRGSGVAYHPVVFGLAATFVVFALFAKVGDAGLGALPDWLSTMQKTDLPLLRFAHILALAYVVCHLPVWQWLRRVPETFVLTRMGRQSLPVFMAGSLLSMTGWIIATATGGGAVIDTVLVVTGASLMAQVATFSERGWLNLRPVWRHLRGAALVAMHRPRLAS
jgi:hypothetical protein